MGLTKKIAERLFYFGEEIIASKDKYDMWCFYIKGEKLRTKWLKEFLCKYGNITPIKGTFNSNHFVAKYIAK